MPHRKDKKMLGRERLQRVIELCRAVEEKGFDPFTVDIDDLLAIIREYFPEWTSFEDFCLDVETINRLSSVVKLQGEWVKRRSTSLYRDPFLIEQKIRSLGKEEFVEILLKAWHPIIALEQITPQSLSKALKYWMDLLPLDKRWASLELIQVDTKAISKEDLIKEGLMSERAFIDELESFWMELIRRSGAKAKIRYWDFIGADTFSETVKRAYMASFLVTYRYATLEIDRLKEKIFISPNEKPTFTLGEKQVASIPISISREEWKRWKEGKKT